MRNIIVTAAVLTLPLPAAAQVLPQRPPNSTNISCGGLPVVPFNIQIRYGMVNVRPNGQPGTFKLWYQAPHANESSEGLTTARFLSGDVDVQEEFNDMGVWIMRQNFGRNRWVGQCVRSNTSGVLGVYGIEILGNLQHIEPYDPGDECDDQPTEIDYDPYDEYDDETNCGDSGGGSGSGTQYSPGDYTGGETVDWSTGVGNGGTSACGQDAVVEYVCIDFWDGEQWQEWDCGYATMC